MGEREFIKELWGVLGDPLMAEVAGQRLWPAIATKDALIRELVRELDIINRLTSPGDRNLDNLCRDMGLACDHARAALARAKQEMENE